MTTINLNDLNDANVVSEQEAADVKGGPIYMSTMASRAASLPQAPTPVALTSSSATASSA